MLGSTGMEILFWVRQDTMDRSELKCIKPAKNFDVLPTDRTFIQIQPTAAVCPAYIRKTDKLVSKK